MTGRLATRNGIWYNVICYKNIEGQYKQKWISTGLKERGNKKEAQKLLNENLSTYAFLENPELSKQLEEKNVSQQNIDRKTIANDKAEMPFIDYLIEFVEAKKGELSPPVFNNYRNSYIKSLQEYFEPMQLKLKELTTQHILDYYEHLREKGNKNITIKHQANIIRPALRQAYKEKIISENPYDFMPTLKKEKRIPTYYNQQDMEKFFNVIKGHHLELAFHMLAYYGLRRSELLGIRWQAIDFTNKTISINHKVLHSQGELYLSDTMKTDSSCRTLPLIPIIEKELLEHKAKIEKNIQYFGTAYNMDYIDYVFVHENGDLILPDCVTHNMLKVIRRFGLKHIRLHDLRHSCASIMIKNGAQMKQVQEWLGHSNFSTTADVYSHLDFSSKIDSAEKIAAVLDFENEEEKQLTARPSVPKEIAEFNEEKKREQDIDLIFSNLKTQMLKNGFTKLSDLFLYLEKGSQSNEKAESEGNAEM